MSLTPKPWVYGTRRDDSKWLSLGDPKNGQHRQGDLCATKEDADLICAAPDLLAALKSLEPIFEELHAKWDEGMRAGKLLIALMDPTLKYRDDITAIHAAISKAEGK